MEGYKRNLNSIKNSNPLCYAVQIGEDDPVIYPSQIELITQGRDFHSRNNELCQGAFEIMLFEEAVKGLLFV
jgi:hypothetical protein